MLPCLLVAIFFPLTCGFPHLGGPLQVEAPVGDIIGFVSDLDFDGAHYQMMKWLGIPYAESPTGDRRFRKPTPKAHFAAPFNATSPGENCYALEVPTLRNSVLSMSEDCLILNIYVPFSSKLRLPVMVWIYGGGFVLGTSNTYIADRLSVFGEVIVVTVNYRLAVYGFLSTGDADAPGNYGLWDQQLAIQWVQDNIEAFGGDKTSVTIFGQSAGSSSVVYQSLYPGNKGLFQRVIAQSASASSPGALSVNPKGSAVRFAETAGCKQPDWSSKLDCLRRKPISELNNTLNDPSKGLGPVLWAPVVDGEFVLEDPAKMLEQGLRSAKAREMFLSVDFMIGTNNLDGGVIVASLMQQYRVTDPDNLAIPRSDFEHKFIPKTIQVYFSLENVSDVVRKTIVQEYTDWADPADNANRLRLLMDMTTDTSFLIPSAETIIAHTRGSKRNTFFYQFSTSSPANLLPLPSTLAGQNSANHGDEVFFVFGLEPEMIRNFRQGQAANITMEQLEEAKAIMTMWTNFAKSGDPNKPMDIKQYTHTPWPQYDTMTQRYFEITSNMGPGSIKERLRARYVELWTNLLPSLRHSLLQCVKPTSPPAPIPVDIIG